LSYYVPLNIPEREYYLLKISRQKFTPMFKDE